MKIQKHTYRTGIACAIALWILAGCGSPEERAKAYYESGMQYVTSQDYPKAAIEFRNALKINENLADAWYGMALVEQEGRAWDRAYADLIKTLEIDPKHLKALGSISALLAVSGDQVAALKYIDTAIGVEPQNPDFLSQRASLLYQTGKKEEGVAEANKAMALKPNHAGAIIVLAAAKIDAGDFAAALKLIEPALAAEPKVLGLHLIKLNALRSSKDLVQQEAAIRGIVAAFPENAEYRTQLFAFLSANNRNDDVIKEMRAAMAAKPDDPKIAMEMVAFTDHTKGRPAARIELVELSKSQKEPFPFLLALAELDFQEGRVEDSEKQLRELIKTKGVSDDGMQAQLVLNSQLIVRNKIDEAEAGIAEVLKHDGENTDALKQRAAIRINQGKFDPAIEDLRAVLSNTKSDAKALALLSSAYERNGQMELAESALVDAAQAKADDPGFSLNYVSFLMRRGKQEQAQTLLQSVVDRFPANREALVMMAELYQRTGDWERAADMAQRLKGINGADPTPSLIQGQSLLAQRRFDDAITMLESGGSKSELNPSTMKALVQAYIAANRVADASTYLDRIVKANPNNSNAMVLQSALLRREGKMAEAEERLLEAIKAEPASPHPYVALTYHYDGLNKPEQALAVIKQGIDATKDKAPLRLMLAALHEKAGRVDDAIAVYDVLVAETPDSMVVANNLASLLTDHRSDQASLDRAVELAKVLKDSPVPEFRETLGWALFSSGKQREGLKLLEGGIAALNKFPAAHYHLGVAYAAQKKDDLAKTSLTTALGLQPPPDLKVKIEAALAKLK